jgi:hypothetical protein
MNFVGNKKAVNFLEKSIEKGKIAQAYLFSGPENIGKFILAKIFSRSLIVGESFDAEIDKDFRNILDLIILEPEIEEKKGIIKEKEIKVEHIRKVQKDLSLFPYSGKYKVLIINNAHRMSLASQNAILKSLEEPNGTSIIILITHKDSEIISTIKSRCQKINFSLVSSEEIEKALEGNKGNSNLTIFSMGRPGLAFKISNDPEELEQKEHDFLDFRNFSSLGINERLKLAEKMSADLTRAEKKLEFWIWLIRSEIGKKGESGNFFSFQAIKKIEKSLEKVKNTNASPRLVIECLFLEI